MQASWLLVLAVVVGSCAPKPKAAAAVDDTNRRRAAHGEQDMFSRADAYERFMGRWSKKLAPALVEYSEVREGGAVLDLGSGTGAFAFAVRDVTKTTQVLGIDLSPEYVGYASRKSADARVRFEVGDAQALHQPDGSFDRVVSLLVLNFVPDPRRAVGEMIRVAKPGGIVSSAVWDYAEGMEMLRVFWDEAMVLDPALAERDEKNMPLCQRGELAALFREAKLEAVSESELVADLEFSSFADYWEPFLLGQGPAGAYAASLPRERQEALRKRLRARLLGAGPDRAIDMRARAWAAKGTVPPR
jgi:ubiquinone/menaquinone biosynthesis C-methylase UbiE